MPTVLCVGSSWPGRLSLANAQVDAVPSQWEDSSPMAKSITRCASLAGIAFVLLALSANSVHAWGDTAHRIICEIAFKELNSQARDEVKRLIRLDPVFFHLLRFVHLARSSQQT